MKAMSPAKPRLLRFFWTWTKRLMGLAFALCLVGMLGAYLLIRHYAEGLPSTTAIENDRYRPPQVTRVLARDGKTVLAELYTERRTWVSIGSLPAKVKLAFLAAEDAHFYEHAGVNYLGIIRALVVNLRAGRTRQGASTITQQVVKNVLLEPERSYRRKIREAILAHHIEKKLTKDQILELYLNQIYLGHGRYGVEEASKYYYGHAAKDMTLAQAAALAGIVANPERFSRTPSLTERRRRFVLRQMFNKGFLKKPIFDKALRTEVIFHPTGKTQSQLAPEAVTIAKRVLAQAAGPGAALGGYTIRTSIDPALQRAARQAVRDNLSRYDKRHGLLARFRAHSRRSRLAHLKPFVGTPSFEAHRVLVGEVVGADDKLNKLYIKVGTVRGVVHLDDYQRYLPRRKRGKSKGKGKGKDSGRQHTAALKASQFAEKGSLLRVSLLAPPPTKAQDAPPTPLRLEMGPESALVAIDVRSREVLALVGSYEGLAGDLDRATQAKRQPGSTFKPIVYSYAIHARRFTAATLVQTRRGSVGSYQAKNYDSSEGAKPVRLREALAHSINVAALHVLKDVGPSNVVHWARELGITTKLGADLSLALGSYETRPIEMVAAYATFAGGGVWKPARIVLEIKDSQGHTLPLPGRMSQVAKRVMTDAEAYVTTSMLTSVIDHGTGRRARVLRRPLAGKTGTTNKSKDAWFVGYSTDIACAVWTGYDDARPLGRHETGASAALPAWIAFMKQAHEGRPPTEFPRPPDVSVIKIDPETGLLARDDQPDAMQEFFLDGTEPAEVAPEAEDAGADVQVPDATAPALGLDAGHSQKNMSPPDQRDAGVIPMLPPPADTVPLF